MKKYYIWMEEIGDLEEGWFCGIGKRVNQQYYRTMDKRDADFFDDMNAVLFCKDFKDYGYPCKVVPKVPVKRILDILYGTSDENDEDVDDFE